MHAVRVIPHKQEIRRGGLEVCDAENDLIAVHDAVGVGVLGYAPHALDRRILNELLYHVHIGAVIIEGDGYHLHTEALGDGEMPVITGSGTKEFDLVELCPFFL